MSGKRHWITVKELGEATARATFFKRLAVAGILTTVAGCYFFAQEAQIVQSLKANLCAQSNALQDYKGRNAELVIELAEQSQTLKEERRHFREILQAFKRCDRYAQKLETRP